MIRSPAAMGFVFLILVCLTAGTTVHGQDAELAEGKREKPRPLYHQQPAEEVYVPGTFQSDMLLTLPQVVDLYLSVSEQMSGKQKRRAVRSTKWPLGIIPFEIDDNFGENIRHTIKKAMDLWEENTCITFRNYTAEVAEELGSEHRVLFQKVTKGCVSWIGMIDHFPQTISLAEDNCDYMGTIAHEIGHAVGWYHEQGRPDRDEYVTILYDNIRAGYQSNFQTYEVETYGIPYDLHSIMHYGAQYFTKSWLLLTIEPRNPLDLFRMGNREDFSFYDRKMANVMYECSSVCDPLLQCENEGYVGKDCNCHCPPEYSGSRCEVYMQGSDEAGCSRELSADKEAKSFTSPGYPNLYDNYLTCAWLIQGPPNSTLTLVFTDFDIEMSKRFVCFDYVQVRNDTYIYSGGEDYCGNEPPPPIMSTENQMMVVLHTDVYGRRKGFRAIYYVTPESGTTTPPMASTVVSTMASAHTTTHTSAQTAAPTTTSTTVPPTTKTTIKPTFQTTVTAQLPTSPKPSKCESVEGTCGGAFTGSGCIASPNYGQGSYNNNQACVYHIQVDAGKRVQLTVEDMDIEEEVTCTWDRLVVIPGDTLGSLRACGSEPPFGTFVSLDNTMTVKMISDGYVAKGGFAASFQGITVD